MLQKLVDVGNIESVNLEVVGIIILN